MQKSPWSFIAVLITLITLSLGFSQLERISGDNNNNFSSGEIQEASLEAFDQMMQVAAHKRCVNCHPSGNKPNQGEDSHVHLFEVQRGGDGHGVAALQCNTCHQSDNNNFSGVPGAPHWHLAPRSMGWKGLSKIEIAQAITDPIKNGGRNIQEIEKHLTEDPLVLWAFEPGINHAGIEREKPPISKEAYIAAVKQWIKTGAQIPAAE